MKNSIDSESASSDAWRSDSRLRDLVDDIDAIVWEADVSNWQFTFVSRQAEKLLGYPVECWLEDPDFWVKLIHDQDRERCIRHCTECTDRCEDHAFEYRALAADGRVVWLRDIVRVVPDESGAARKLRGVMIDITRKKESESALQEREALFRTIFAQAGIGVAQIDSNSGVIQRVNRRYCQVLGAQAEQLVGKTWMELTHPDDLAADSLNMSKLRSGEIREFTMEKRLHRPDGELLWVRLNVSPMWGPDEPPTTHIAILEDITEAKRTNEEIHQLDVALENAMQGISRLDRHGRYVMVKPQYAELLGYTPAELIGQSWEATVVSEDRATANATYDEMLRVGRAECECRGQHKDGGSFFKHVLLIKSFDEQKQFDGHYCFMRDITQRVVAEQSLQNSRARLAEQLAEVELLYRMAPVGLCMVDTELRYVRINEVLANVNGVPVEDHIGRSIHEVVPNIADQLNPLYTSVIETGEAVVNFEISRPNPAVPNERQFYLVNYHPLQDASGAVVAVSAVIQDVTDQKRVEASVRDSEKKFRSLTEQSPAIIFIACQEQLVFFNPAAAAITGYAQEEIQAMNVRALVHDDDHAILAEIHHEDLPGEDSPRRAEIRIVTKSGEIRWVALSSQNIEFQNATAVLMTCIDISDRKNAEEKIRRMDAQLAHVSRLSTMGEMVAGIAHEINQPLCAIGNYSLACQNIVQASEIALDERIGDWLEFISEEADRCGDIIRRLRSFVRKSDNEREWIDLASVVRDSISLVGNNLSNRSIVIEFDVAGAEIEAFVNSVEIRQVIVNLLRNACEAVRDVETPQVAVRIANNKDRISIIVVDNGPGIEESQLWQIFDAFYTTKSEGMGMGLAISRSIVEAHKGNLRFEPASPTGSQFHVELPLKHRHEGRSG